MIWILGIIVFLFMALCCFLLINGSDERKWNPARKQFLDDEQERVLKEMAEKKKA